MILSFILPKAYRDYRIFKSYGPGGVPYNVFGWLIVRCIFCSFGREVFSTSEYDWRIAAGESQSFLTLTEEQLHARKADGRPVVGPHPVPQRQLTQIPDETVKQKIREEFAAFASRNKHLVQTKLSKLEKHTDALFVADSLPWSRLAKQMNGEIAHIHGQKDHSVHAILPPADCKILIDSGWAQRHPFSGTRARTYLSLGTENDIPSEFILLYAPRNEVEVGIIMQIIAASVRYMTDRVDLL
ncbi:hypothetical protein VTN31DRAFT_4471 [Thermomyces dupontii]|uniref:uncharacterized protein n=1 Tax=Talaromyces thermophilus TaxID=28565 RepID=UPI00374393AE